MGKRKQRAPYRPAYDVRPTYAPEREAQLRALLIVLGLRESEIRRALAGVEKRGA